MDQEDEGKTGTNRNLTIGGGKKINFSWKQLKCRNKIKLERFSFKFEMPQSFKGVVDVTG